MKLGFVAVNIGVASIDRAANILAEIQRKVGARGWAVGNGEGSSIRIEEEPVELLLSEQTEQIPHIATAEEIRDHQRYLRWIPEHDVIRSGRLQLSITNAHYLGVRQKWADGKRQRLEDLLDRFLDGAQAAASALKTRRLEREEQRRRWEEAENRRQERERRDTIERVRGAVLRQQAAAHKEARRLHAYVEEVKAQVQHGTHPNELVLQWIRWAEEHVKRLDPLSRDLPVLLPEEEAVRQSWRYPKS